LPAAAFTTSQATALAESTSSEAGIKVMAEETTMQNHTAGTIAFGTQREFVCAWCSNVSNKPKVRQHVYSEDRSFRQLGRFWECRACGHQRPASILDDVRENIDPLTDRLHAQWRQDNEGLLLTPRQRI
jgi:hypothetical protein